MGWILAPGMLSSIESNEQDLCSYILKALIIKHCRGTKCYDQLLSSSHVSGTRHF